MPHRVLVFGEFGTCNGGENSFLALVPSLIRRRWEFHAAVPVPSDFADALRETGVEIHDFSVQPLDRPRKTQAEVRAEVADLIGRVEPDIIHGNSLSTSRICGPVASKLGIPSLGYLRDILKLSKQAIADINELDWIVAVSAATRDWHCNQGIDADKTSIVYNGVDTGLFYPRPNSGPLECGGQTEMACPTRSELGIAADASVLLFIGQIGIRKGVDTLVDAFLRVADFVPQVHLLIVGQRFSKKQESLDFENRLKEKTESSSHRKNIHWLGIRNDIPQLMRAATILVHPARQEPLGRVLLEAAASGLPIITTRVGGSPEILSRPESEDFLIQPNDPVVLSEKIRGLLDDPRLQDVLRLELREIALGAFSIDLCSGQLESHYLRLLSR